MAPNVLGNEHRVLPLAADPASVGRQSGTAADATPGRRRNRIEADDRAAPVPQCPLSRPRRKATAMTAIEIDQVTKRFGDVVAVDRLSFGVRSGAVTGFLGPHGAGKSTTLRVLLGLVRPTAGVAVIGGRRYADLRQPFRHVGA